MRLGLFSAIDSGPQVGVPVPARPCISGPRALVSLSLTLRRHVSKGPQGVQFSIKSCPRVVATSMAMNRSKRTVELMCALGASPSSWLVRLVMEWHY
jgi:hypothetical protein